MKIREYLSEVTVSGSVDTYDVPYSDKKKKGYLRVDIPPAQRSFGNMPRYSNKKSKVRFQDWLELDTKGFSKYGASVGKSPNGKHYGWSHRAVFGFKPGQVVKTNDHIGRDKKRKCPYKITNDKDAMWHAIRFSKEVS